MAPVDRLLRAACHHLTRCCSPPCRVSILKPKHCWRTIESKGRAGDFIYGCRFADRLVPRRRTIVVPRRDAAAVRA